MLVLLPPLFCILFPKLSNFLWSIDKGIDCTDSLFWFDNILKLCLLWLLSLFTRMKLPESFQNWINPMWTQSKLY